MEETRNVYIIVAVRHKGKNSLRGRRRRSECNIKVDLKKIVYEEIDWFQLFEDRVRCGAVVENTVADFRVP
jgi:hypothetical protein